MRSSLSCPPASEPSDVPCFQAHEWTPPSSSPPVGESLFATCHVSELSNPLLPLPPLQSVFVCTVPSFLAHQPTPPSSSPPSTASPSRNLPHLRSHQLLPPSSSPPVRVS